MNYDCDINVINCPGLRWRLALKLEPPSGAPEDYSLPYAHLLIPQLCLYQTVSSLW